MSDTLNEDFWERLLTLIEEGNVLPVIGAGVVTCGDDERLLYPWLARRLAEKLSIPPEHLPAEFDLNAVATAHLLNRGRANDLYLTLRCILRDECPPPGQALKDLASVSAFNLFLTTTFDPLLENAVNQIRHGGKPGAHVYAFSTYERPRDLPARRQELTGTNIFHMLGRVDSKPGYAVWEEDMLEFILKLNGNMSLLKNLGEDLQEQGLLVLGLQFSDWLVRFFLRVTKQGPLSKLVHTDYFTDDGPGKQVPASLVLFFGAVSPDIRVMRQDPVAFCAELARRWKTRHSEEPAATKLLAVDPEMPRDAIFISYAREDEPQVANLVRGLQAHGCTVWFDRERLKAGENWHNGLEKAVRRDCALFLSVISKTTAGTGESYYHLERNWASERAERMAHDVEFYIPVVIDDTSFSGNREPKRFEHIQATVLANGIVTEDFATRLLQLQKRASATPR